MVMNLRRLKRRAERGVTMLVVLILLTVMLLGGLALARMTEAGTLASGNVAYHEAAVQASDIGLNTAFAQINALTNEEMAANNWYSPVERAKDTHGLPTVTWANAPSITVGQTTVRYVAERACSVAKVDYPLRQCLVKQIPQAKSHVAGTEELDPPNSKQFRITVQVTDQRGTQIYVQSLVTKG
ncbi:hypothetical protein CKO44_15450 [Rubrivivax gelatinosus]|uniref:Type IV pilus assembly protein PilX n=2 Tax=Rubrivivax gelatinosus TaxID=28068 RepID=A0ABS1DWJ1_RUBGE|nr:hypothetical protein [Rubrivivax gelatinosus]MBK1713476.1 hypothetical protein [Rubrivivax gelatinosus]MBZ8143143.1 hypothetical protein [Rubrivivax gelatinosus]